jgi:PAS domain S-box-containing protein
MRAQEIRSLLLVPIFVDRQWWGFIGFDDCLGERLFAQVEVEALRAAAGAIGAAIGREAAEVRRHEAETLYRALVDASPVAIVVLDIDENVVLWNEAAEQMYGWTADEVVGTQVPTRPAQLEHEYRLFLESVGGLEGIASFETFRRRKDGRLIDVSISVAPVHDANGEVVGTLGAHVDITESKRAEQALRERERQFRAVFDSSRDALAIADDDGRLIEVNEAAVALYGWTKDDIVGRAIEDLATEDQRAAVERLWRTALQEGEIETDFELARPDGSRRSVELAVRANFLPGRHLTVARDVTDRKALEAQLLHSQRMEAVGRLAGGIAHDFNNLLTAIQGYADFLQDGLDAADPLRGDAEQISRASDRAAGLVRQLLAFSRKQLLHPEIVDLNAVVRDTEAMLRRLIGEDVDLVTHLEPGLASVLADAGQLEQTIINLAVNARDAMPDGGSLTLSTTTVGIVGRDAERLGISAGSYVRLDVRDTGIGMDGATQLRAFEPFFTTKEQGTGLGLATAYGIVTQSGGQIDVESEPGVGTTFSVYLPAARAAARLEGDGAGLPAANGGSETVLLVEDEDIVRSLARRILHGSGYEVIEAGSGEEALRLARGHDGHIDLLLTDVVMPGMNGRELADRLTELRPGTRVVYMSGYTEDVVLQRGISGDRAFLAKPFTATALAQEVRDVLDGAKAT